MMIGPDPNAPESKIQYDPETKTVRNIDDSILEEVDPKNEKS